MTTDSNFFDGLPCHLVMLLDIAFIRYSSFLLKWGVGLTKFLIYNSICFSMVSGDTVYQITYYASDVYMLQKTGYIYI